VAEVMRFSLARKAVDSKILARRVKLEFINRK
jgi:hypothetical protein